MADEKRDCIHCGWAMGEREGEPQCEHCKTTETKTETIRKEN